MRVAEPFISPLDVSSVLQALQDTELSGRSEICRKFEQGFANRMGARHGVSVNSGTSALFLALKALGIGPGDEVIVPVFAYIAVANAVRHVGATPIFCDVEEETFNIDPSKIEPTARTKAIIVVHTYGHPADMDKIMAFGIPVIEDAAEAHGALYKGQPVGSIGEIGCFSFFANKTMTTGEGGMVITNKMEIRDEIFSMRDQYLRPGYKHDKIGWSMCLGGLQCALGLSQLAQLDQFLEVKRSMAALYSQYEDRIGMPITKEYARHSWWMYAIKRNKKLEKFLHKNGIETRPGFVPITKQKPYRRRASYPVAESLDLMCLPMNVRYGNAEVVKKIEEFYAI